MAASTRRTPSRGPSSSARPRRRSSMPRRAPAREASDLKVTNVSSANCTGNGCVNPTNTVTWPVVLSTTAQKIFNAQAGTGKGSVRSEGDERVERELHRKWLRQPDDHRHVARRPQHDRAEDLQCPGGHRQGKRPI